jgi:DNA helicase-2/ATP-dependent DNA helicase PcrA
VDPDLLLAALDPEQRAAAVAGLAPRRPVVIVAGAGTGKTRTITHRIGYAVATGAQSADRVLAVTFTARAAGELRSRLRGLAGADASLTAELARVQARTFHAAALRQLSYFWPRVIGGELPRLIDSKLPLVGQAVARSRLRASQPELRDLASEIEWAKARLLTPDGYAAGAAKAHREPPAIGGTTDPIAQTAALFAAYEDVKTKAGSIDFDDLLLLTAAAIEEHDDVAEEVQHRYQHFVVDEYQDVNPAQQRLLDAWLGGRDDLCVVGDDDQTIYSFTGASRDYLVGFARRYPQAEVVQLVRDYRSTPEVVTLANAVLAAAPASSRLVVKELRAQQPSGPAPAFAGHADEPAEAAWVAARIRDLADAGTSLREIAVLYRINAQSEVYEAALTDAGLPYVVRGGERFFARREVREALAGLRTAARTSYDAPDGLMAQVHEVLALLGWQPDQPPAGAGAARDRWESLAALSALAAEMVAADPEITVARFAAELEQRASDQHVPTVDGVTLASLHAAKGLEWDAVFLVGLVDGTLPITHAVSPDEIAEERRLLYVGITRARRHIAMSWAAARAEGGRRSRKRSRFLDEIAERGSWPGLPPAAVLDAHAGSARTPARGPALCRVCGKPVLGTAARRRRRCETCPGSVDEALFERLRDWRRERAAGLGQPAYCVFTDATLEAIAETRPSSVGELRSIPGIGDGKLERFGAEVLELLTAP